MTALIVALGLAFAATGAAMVEVQRRRDRLSRECLRCNGSGKAARLPYGRSRCPLCRGTGRRPLHGEGEI